MRIDAEDSKGVIFENFWQFSKIYETVKEQKQVYNRFRPTDGGWTWPSETHIIHSKPSETNSSEPIPNKKYWEWRKAGFEFNLPVRYPAGIKDKRLALFSLNETSEKDTFEVSEGRSFRVLNYIDARKQIYLKRYTDEIKKIPYFKKLLLRLKKEKIFKL